MKIKGLCNAGILIINKLLFLFKLLRGVKVSSRKLIIGTKIKSNGANNTIICQDGGKIRDCKIHIYGSNNQIIVGKNTSLIGLEIWIEDDNNVVTIGNNTTLYGKSHYACMEGTKIEIGDNCLFSSEIKFMTGDSHSITNLDGERINLSQNIVIGNKVWIGTKVIVTKGVNIADDCIIGTGSIVNKSFTSSNVVIAGIPAKIVKENVSWNKKRLPVEELAK